MRTMSSDAQSNKVLARAAGADDQISKLPDDVLLKILSKLLTVESVRTSTLSSRWVHLWKELPQLNVDMRKIPKEATPVLTDAGRSMTKVIRDHRGNLKNFSITHHSYQCDVGMIETWIQALVHSKHVNFLSLINYFGYPKRNEKANTTLVLTPDSFSDPNLRFFVLSQYNLEAPHGFNKCSNLRIVHLNAFASIDVFNTMLASCTALEVATLLISCHERSGPLKIDNSKLKILILACYNIDRVEVSTLSVDVLHVKSLSCGRENLIIANPNLQFNRKFRVLGPNLPNTCYNISCPHQGNKGIGHALMTKGLMGFGSVERRGSMSVRVDLLNTKEVALLKEVLATWTGEIDVLEIMFKNNIAPRGEGESFIGGTQTKPFPNAVFRADTVWMSNFSGSKEEFALASCFITQGTVVSTMMVTPPSWFLSASEILEIKTAFDNLRKLPKGHQKLRVTMDLFKIAQQEDFS